MSFKPEVQTDDTGKGYANALRLSTRDEAEAQVRDLMMRWVAVRDTRVIECDDPVNHRYIDHRLEPVETAAEPVPSATERLSRFS